MPNQGQTVRTEQKHVAEQACMTLLTTSASQGWAVDTAATEHFVKDVDKLELDDGPVAEVQILSLIHI